MFLDRLDDPNLVLICLLLAVFRITLELVKFRFESLPITKLLFKRNGARFHQVGLYLSIGYVVLFAPGILLS